MKKGKSKEPAKVAPKAKAPEAPKAKAPEVPKAKAPRVEKKKQEELFIPEVVATETFAEEAKVEPQVEAAVVAPTSAEVDFVEVAPPVTSDAFSTDELAAEHDRKRAEWLKTQQ